MKTSNLVYHWDVILMLLIMTRSILNARSDLHVATYNLLRMASGLVFNISSIMKAMSPRFVTILKATCLTERRCRPQRMCDCLLTVLSRCGEMTISDQWLCWQFSIVCATIVWPLLRLIVLSIIALLAAPQRHPQQLSQIFYYCYSQYRWKYGSLCNTLLKFRAGQYSLYPSKIILVLIDKWLQDRFERSEDYGSLVSLHE